MKNKTFRIGESVQVIKKIEVDEKTIDYRLSLFSDIEKKERKKKIINNIKEINNKIKDGLFGTIIQNNIGDFYIVRFDEEQDYFQNRVDFISSTTSVDLMEKKYLVLNKENLKKVSGDKNGYDIVLAIKRSKISDSNNVLERLSSIASNILSQTESLKRYQEEYFKTRESVEKNQESYNKYIEYISKISLNVTDSEIKRIEKISNNKKIKKIQYIEHNGSEYLAIRTNNLKYQSERVQYNQGNFVILFNLTSKTISLFGNRYYREYTHPCSTGIPGSICFGEQQMDVNMHLENGDILSLIQFVINFLEEPNYETPHKDDYLTYFGQPLKENKEFDFDNLEEYVCKQSLFSRIVNSNWDEDQYQKDKEKKAGKKLDRIMGAEDVEQNNEMF